MVMWWQYSNHNIRSLKSITPTTSQPSYVAQGREHFSGVKTFIVFSYHSAAHHHAALLLPYLKHVPVLQPTSFTFINMEVHTRVRAESIRIAENEVVLICCCYAAVLFCEGAPQLAAPNHPNTTTRYKYISVLNSPCYHQTIKCIRVQMGPVGSSVLGIKVI